MFKIYNAETVKKLISRVEREYEDVLSAQRKCINELKENNRLLQAKLSVLQHQRAEVASAIIEAEKAGSAIRASADAYAKARREGIYRLAERCRQLANDLAAKYPNEEDVKAFKAYLGKLDEALETNGEGELDMDKILYPQQGLKLENLCKELGLMEDGEI